MYVLCSEHIKEEEVKELETILGKNYPDLCLNSLAYARSKSLANTKMKEEDHSGFGRLFTSNLNVKYRCCQKWIKYSKRFFIGK